MNDPVVEQYQGERGLEYHEGKRSIPAAAVPWVARLRAEKLAPHIHPDDTVLEYGAGFGWNLAMLSCRRRLAYDVSAHLEPEIRRQGLEFVSDIGLIPDGTVDVVICHHVLEHIAAPLVALEVMKRVLRHQGLLLLFVPFEKERRYQQYDPGEPNHHLYSWNVQTLGNLVNASGFAIAQAGLGKYGYDRFNAKWACRFHLGETGFRALRQMANVLCPLWEVRLAAKKP